MMKHHCIPHSASNVNMNSLNNGEGGQFARPPSPHHCQQSARGTCCIPSTNQVQQQASKACVYLWVSMQHHESCNESLNLIMIGITMFIWQQVLLSSTLLLWVIILWLCQRCINTISRGQPQQDRPVCVHAVQGPGNV